MVLTIGPHHPPPSLLCRPGTATHLSFDPGSLRLDYRVLMGLWVPVRLPLFEAMTRANLGPNTVVVYPLEGPEVFGGLPSVTVTDVKLGVPTPCPSSSLRTEKQGVVRAFGMLHALQ